MHTEKRLCITQMHRFRGFGASVLREIINIIYLYRKCVDNERNLKKRGNV